MLSSCLSVAFLYLSLYKMLFIHFTRVNQLFAWCDLTNVSNCTCIDAFLRESKCLGYCDVITSPVVDLFDAADDAMFSRITLRCFQLLKPRLPNHSSYHYHLHSWWLRSAATPSITNCFIIKTLFKDSYWYCLPTPIVINFLSASISLLSTQKLFCVSFLFANECEWIN